MSKNLVVHYVLLFISSLIIPCLGLLWVPCYIFRCFVFIIATVFRSDLECMLGPNSTLLNDDDFHKNPSNCSIVTVLRLQGSLTLSQITNIFDCNVIRAKLNKSSKTPRYPELKQYPVNFMGYLFWKWDTHFSLEKHIFECNDKSTSLSEIHQNVMNNTYPKYQSPWQLIIFKKNHARTEVILVFKNHHCISDGRSVIKLLVECLGQKILSTKEAKYKRITTKEKIRQLISMPAGLVNLPADLIKFQMNVAWHPWQRRVYCKVPFQLYVRISKEIPLDLVKIAAKITNVQVSALFISVVTSAIRKFARLRNQKFENLSIYLTLPKEGHPPTLSNHLYIGIPDIPLIEDDLERAQISNGIYNCMRYGEHTRHFETLLGMVVTFPDPLRKYLITAREMTVGLSNIAGEQEGFAVGGNTCINFSMSTGILKGSSIGMDFTVLSYKEYLQVSVVAKGNVFSERDATIMTGLVEEEFLNLKTLIGSGSPHLE